MGSLIPGYEYDIFISYRQKDNKYDGWVTEFVNNLKKELEATFKEDISLYFDINPHDGLLETHDVDASLKDKLKCLIFIPIISRTYCDPKSFAWEHEFKTFIDQTSKDQFGLKVKLPNGNVATRILPIQIHDLYPEDKALLEKELGGVLRAIEFIYKEPGINKPLTADDDEKRNLNNTKYRLQVNKVANAIDELIHCLKGKEPVAPDRKALGYSTDFVKAVAESDDGRVRSKPVHKYMKWLIVSILLLICIVGGNLIYKGLKQKYLNPQKSSLEKSIAVLPFVNDSPDKENEYFCNGMMEEILNQLQKISDLRVKSRTSSEKYRDSHKDIREIGRELDVAMIMEGSVRKVGDDLRIYTQLINAKTGDHLWSEVYDGKYTTDILSFLPQVAKRVANSLNAVITLKEEKGITTVSTLNMQVYDLNLRASEMYHKWQVTFDTTFLKLGFNLCEQSLKIEPDNKDALRQKASLFIESSKPDSALFYLHKVKRLYQDDSIYSGLGVLYFYNNNSDSALKYIELALEENQNDPWANLVMGQCKGIVEKDIIEGLPYLNKAFRLGKEESSISFNISVFANSVGEYQKSLKYLNNCILLKPEFRTIKSYIILKAYTGEYNKALIYLDSICNLNALGSQCDIMRFYVKVMQKDFREAERFYRMALKGGYKTEEDDYPFIAYMYIETGRKSEAFSMLKNSIAKDEKWLIENPNSIFSNLTKSRLAASYTLVGEKSKAIKKIDEIGIFGGFFPYFLFDKYPGFDILRNEPEFNDITRRLLHEQDSIRLRVREMELNGEIDL
jgi:TolB-like protein